MATYLYKVGRWAYANRFKTIAIWVLVLIGMGVGASLLAKPTSESFSIPGIPSEQAQNLMVERFPDKPKFGDSVEVTYVVAAPKGSSLTEPRYQQAIGQMVDSLRGIDQVKDPASIASPFTTYGTQQDPGKLRSLVAASQEQIFGKSPQQAAAVAQALSPISADNSAAQLGASFSVETASDLSQSTKDRLESIADDARAAGLTVAMKLSLIHI